ncbi:MAG: rRNA maturation RNase YbeY [Rhodothermales bacterium]|nr:rRNA maturation RNase YbeY [Rhodothermales bacterium]
MLDVEVDVEHATLLLDENVVRRLVVTAVREYSKSDERFKSIGIILTGRDFVHRLNREFLGHDYPTDVLSFRITDSPPHEGEVYVDMDTAEKRCIEFGSSFELEAYRYVVHGVLHLLGLDDATDAEKAQMTLFEDAVLATI